MRPYRIQGWPLDGKVEALRSRIEATLLSGGLTMALIQSEGALGVNFGQSGFTTCPCELGAIRVGIGVAPGWAPPAAYIRILMAQIVRVLEDAGYMCWVKESGAAATVMEGVPILLERRRLQDEANT